MSKPVAIVTGASSGIGKATALRLARDFGAIALAARSGEKLGEVGQQIKAIGAEPLVLELDLMALTAAEVVVNKALDRFGAAAVGAINAAIEALAKAFAERGIEDGVQVNSVSPGAIHPSRVIGSRPIGATPLIS